MNKMYTISFISDSHQTKQSVVLGLLPSEQSFNSINTL